MALESPPPSYGHWWPETKNKEDKTCTKNLENLTAPRRSTARPQPSGPKETTRRS
nr:MAG TPA: hypothetical protein [Caudoviricetes sp.]